MPCARLRLRRWRDRRGVSIVLVGLVLILLVGFVSLAIDIGRLRVANAQLQTAADAAARAGALSLPTRSDTPTTSQDVINEAVHAALQNPALAESGPTGVALDVNQDIHFGHWDRTNRVFTPIVDKSNTQQDERRSANAVRVETRRLQARGNPLKLIFAPAIGVFTRDIERPATAYITGGTGDNFGFIGLQRVGSNGNKARLTGGVASDGNIDLGNGDVRSSATAVGDARPGINGELIQKPNSEVEGWTANLDYLLTPLYPPYLVVPPSPPPVTPIPNGVNNYTLDGGVDAAHRLYYSGTVPDNITVNGYVRIYATTNINLMKINVTWENPATPNASRLEYYMTGTAPQVTNVFTNGNTQVWAHVYAPQCEVELGGTADFTGWAIGKTLTFLGNSTFTYDGSKKPNPGPPYKIHLVE